MRKRAMEEVAEKRGKQKFSTEIKVRQGETAGQSKLTVVIEKGCKGKRLMACVRC